MLRTFAIGMLPLFLVACSSSDSGKNGDDGTTGGTAGVTGASGGSQANTGGAGTQVGAGGQLTPGGAPGTGGAAGAPGAGGKTSSGGAGSGVGGVIGAGGAGTGGTPVGNGGGLAVGGSVVGGSIGAGGNGSSSCVSGVDTGDACNPAIDTELCVRSTRECTCSGSQWTCVPTGGEGGAANAGGATGSGGATTTSGGSTGSGGSSDVGGSTSMGGVTGVGGETSAAGGAVTCPFPTSFEWKDNEGGPIATPGNGWVSIKDFTNVVYNGQHIIYMTMHDDSAYGSATMPAFTEWSEAATAPQTKMGVSTVAPELMYFAPKDLWILSYQWCEAKFCYATSSDPTDASSWDFGQALLTEDITSATYGPIDQVLICDTTDCYLFYGADNGHVYRASMPIDSFPGNFSGSESIMQDTEARLFEAVEVYTIKGTGQYLMLVEAQGSGGRYFRAFTADSLGGEFTPIANADTEGSPFAGKSNVEFDTQWTNDISHGDLVRGHDETRTIDPCNLQLLYQGYNPSFQGEYDMKPYRLGLLTLKK